MLFHLSRFYGHQPYGPLVEVTIMLPAGTISGGTCFVDVAHTLIDDHGATGMTHAELDALVEAEANEFKCRGFGPAKTTRDGRVLVEAGTNPFLD